MNKNSLAVLVLTVVLLIVYMAINFFINSKNDNKNEKTYSYHITVSTIEHGVAEEGQFSFYIDSCSYDIQTVNDLYARGRTVYVKSDKNIPGLRGIGIYTIPKDKKHNSIKKITNIISVWKK